MKTIDLSEVSALIPHVSPGTSEPLFVTKNGQPIAAVLPTGDHDVEDLLLSINPKFQEILERSQKTLEVEGGMSSDAVRKKLGLL